MPSSPVSARAPRRALVHLLAAAGLCAQSPDWLLDPSPYRARVEPAADGRDLVLDNGLLRLRLRLQPALALVSLEQRTAGQQLLRAAAPLGAFTIDGTTANVGGLLGQPNRAFLLPEWLEAMTPDPAAFVYEGSFGSGPIEARFPWRRTRPAAPDATWPPRGQHVWFPCKAPPDLPPGLLATVHLELYDGLPLVAHWLELANPTDRTLEVESFTSLRLPFVESEARVENERLGIRLPNVYVETDYSFRAMTGADGSSHSVRWLADPDFATQVNYEKRTRCLLEVKPDVGPAQTLPPGGTFTTFRTFVLAPDREDRERQSLAQRRLYRALAPWSTENPLMMHVRSAEPAAVRAAIDQCADVGFEMAILTFGSGFDVEDDSPQNLARWKDLADYAHGKGVQLGGYSLLSSRRIEPDTDNCIHVDTGKPGGQVFGFAPALASGWGQRYFQKLRGFYERTGFDLLEHDGSYPGDHDAMARPPLQKGYHDSRWVQFAIISDFYRWCRARGVYLNVPDWYFLQGSSKTGMGYRETNWSLPREQQVIHARQNLFDGTREKNASMGWMFVPLTEYHGGGAVATIEPLAEHLPHYELMLTSNLGYGAQACWRGPRLYDGEATRALVVRWVAWFKKYRVILESDVIHTSSRRADGQDLDWVLHCNPKAEPRAMLVAWNPTREERTRGIPVELYYAGLVDKAVAVGEDGVERGLVLDRFGRTRVEVKVPAGGMVW
ncbi:MAG: alpha-galactosidase, partial [Planctomycetes bacterium]|nr:alpha-galactosidase [Planctomycetota bacterium]